MNNAINFNGFTKNSTGIYMLRKMLGRTEVQGYFRSDKAASEALRKANRYNGGGFFLKLAAEVAA